LAFRINDPEVAVMVRVYVPGGVPPERRGELSFPQEMKLNANASVRKPDMLLARAHFLVPESEDVKTASAVRRR
jgi:hypothetical protein